jgi:DNA polymerase-4
MVMARHICYMVLAIDANPTGYYLKIGYEYGIRVKRHEMHARLFSETLYKQILENMYEEIALREKGVAKLSLSVSHFASLHKTTLSLLELDKDLRARSVSQRVQILRERFGLDIVKTANEL